MGALIIFESGFTEHFEAVIKSPVNVRKLFIYVSA